MMPWPFNTAQHMCQPVCSDNPPRTVGRAVSVIPINRKGSQGPEKLVI